jgi:hypothetical protein
MSFFKNYIIFLTLLAAPFVPTTAQARSEHDLKASFVDGIRYAHGSLASIEQGIYGHHGLKDNCNYLFRGFDSCKEMSLVDKFFCRFLNYEGIITWLTPAERAAFFAGQLIVSVPLAMAASMLFNSSYAITKSLGIVPAAASVIAALPTIAGLKHLLLPSQG